METPSRVIPEKLFFRIGEVCALIKVQPHVLRYWETEFPMLTPQKNRAGQRVYRRKDVEMVFRIRDLLYEEKFTIAGAKKKLIDDARAGNTPKPKPASEQLSMESALGVEAEPAAVNPPVVAQPAASQADQPVMKRVLRLIKHDLEDLLTTLNSDASIEGRSK